MHIYQITLTKAQYKQRGRLLVTTMDDGNFSMSGRDWQHRMWTAIFSIFSHFPFLTRLWPYLRFVGFFFEVFLFFEGHLHCELLFIFQPVIIFEVICDMR